MDRMMWGSRICAFGRYMWVLIDLKFAKGIAKKPEYMKSCDRKTFGKNIL